jgi:hypothetical protein
MYKTFREIIDLWGSYATLASDVGEAYVTVQQWAHRNRIPSRAWLKVVSAADARGFAVTLEVLAEIDASASRKTEAA